MDAVVRLVVDVAADAVVVAVVVVAVQYRVCDVGLSPSVERFQLLQLSRLMPRLQQRLQQRLRMDRRVCAGSQQPPSWATAA